MSLKEKRMVNIEVGYEKGRGTIHSVLHIAPNVSMPPCCLGPQRRVPCRLLRAVAGRFEALLFFLLLRAACVFLPGRTP